jgi:cytidine deaminase
MPRLPRIKVTLKGERDNHKMKEMPVKVKKSKKQHWCYNPCQHCINQSLGELTKERKSVTMVQNGVEMPACLMLLYSYCPSGQMEENDEIPTDFVSK